ncbi:hypothetical protein EfmAA610_06460 [Enterococcus faecium]|nr:hypothetical protein EfmAA610_06460 [Enterococcus faecium]
MLDIVPSNTHRSGSLINFAAIFACASVILASPVVVDASSTPKTKNEHLQLLWMQVLLRKLKMIINL